MAIPLISNVGFTEVSSSGSLNTKAGDKTKLPVQFFKLSDNISGNLSLDNNSAHKKIILDIKIFPFLIFSKAFLFSLISS